MFVVPAFYVLTKNTLKNKLCYLNTSNLLYLLYAKQGNYCSFHVAQASPSVGHVNFGMSLLFTSSSTSKGDSIDLKTNDLLQQTFPPPSPGIPKSCFYPFSVMYFLEARKQVYAFYKALRSLTELSQLQNKYGVRNSRVWKSITLFTSADIFWLCLSIWIMVTWSLLLLRVSTS